MTEREVWLDGREFLVEPRGEGMAFVTVAGVKYFVSTYYCPFCKWAGRVGAGSAWCRHKEAAFGNAAEDQDYAEYIQERNEQYMTAAGR